VLVDLYLLRARARLLYPGVHLCIILAKYLFQLLLVCVNVRTPFDPEFSHTTLALIIAQVIASNFWFSILMPYELGLYMQTGSLSYRWFLPDML